MIRPAHQPDGPATMSKPDAFGPLFGQDKPRHTSQRTTTPHNGTAASRAGATVARKTFAQKQKRILDAIAAHGTLTDAEISEITGIKPSSVCSSRGALEKSGKIERINNIGGKAIRRPSRFRDGSSSEVAHQQYRARQGAQFDA